MYQQYPFNREPRARFFLGNILGSVISTVGSIFGGERANEANEDRMHETNAFNAQQAAINRDWQAGQNKIAMDFSERMSNSAHQRQVADLRLAGLNPILSANKGGASPTGVTGSGSAASGSIIPAQEVIGQALRGGVSTAMAAERLEADIDNIEAQTEKTKQDKDTSYSTYRLNDELHRRTQSEVTLNQAKEANERKVGEVLDSQIVSARANAVSEELREHFLRTDVGKVIRNLGIAGRELNPFLDAGSSAKSLVRK